MSEHGGTLLVPIDFSILLENKLTLDGWFILYCLSNNKRELLLEYTEKVNKIKRTEFELLDTKGYIKLKDKSSITLNTIVITKEGKGLVDNVKALEEENKSFDYLFQQLRDTYPLKVPGENGTFRRLHGDLSRCKKLYRRILSTPDGLSMIVHNQILKALRIQINEYTKARKLQFMQNLSTYLHQENYLQYFDGVEVEEERVEEAKGDDI